MSEVSSIPGMLRILLAESDEANAEVATVLATNARQTVIIARDAGEACALAGAPGACFDVVVLDSALPPSGGLEAARRLRAHEGASRLPLIIAAPRREVDPGELVAIPVDGVISKPYRLVDFVNTVATVATSSAHH